MLRTAAREWAAVSPSDALAWVSGLNDPEERRVLAESVVYRMAEQNPREALNLAIDSGFGTEGSLIANLTQQWAEREPAAVQKWTLAQPASPMRDELVSRLTFVLSKQNPQDAGRLAIEEIADGITRNEAVMSVLHQWALRDAAGAAQWVAQFPGGPLRDRARQELAGLAAQRGG
jgi:hypothetical protein